MIERFTGKVFTADQIIRDINHPRNAFNVEMATHTFYDDLSWGIEAVVQPDGMVCSIFVGECYYP